jgi:hypothetical protein
MMTFYRPLINLRRNYRMQRQLDGNLYDPGCLYWAEGTSLSAWRLMI